MLFRQTTDENISVGSSSNSNLNKSCLMLLLEID